MIAPGLTTTDINRDRWEDPEVAAKHIAGRVPMQRWGTTADFSGAAVYLASDASSFHTGDYMLIDGGMSL